MVVKWHGVRSSTRNWNGGGPQGGNFIILEYLSQTNNNFDFIEEDLKYKYFDDASILEIFNLLSIGIARHNPKPHVPFNITNHNQFIPAEYLESQDNQMELNTEKKSKEWFLALLTAIKGSNLELIKSTKLLGTILYDDLRWNQSTEFLVKKANARMRILQQVFSPNWWPDHNIY